MLTLILPTLIALAALAVLTVQPAQAQEDEALWAFAPQFPLVDTRVAEAFVSQMDLDAAGDAGGVTLTYGVEGVTFAADPDQAQDLLRAAGLMPADSEVLLLEEARTCAVWASNADLEPVAEALGAELVSALDALGLAVADCEVADDIESADLLVWAADEEPEDFDPFTEGTDGFLASAPEAGETPDETATPEATGTPEAGGEAGGDDKGEGGGSDDGKAEGAGDGKADLGPDPAQGGFGVFDDDGGNIFLATMFAGAVVAALLLGARHLTGRVERKF